MYEPTQEELNFGKPFMDEKWQDRALKYLRVVALRQPYITSDDVWKLAKERCDQFPGEPRSMGGVFQRAAREGVIDSTDYFCKSGSKANHHRPIRRWRSLVYVSIRL